MPSEENSRLHSRALRMLEQGSSLHIVLHFVRERLPQTRGLQSAELQKVNSDINDIVERRRRKWLRDDEQAVDTFFKVAASF